MTTDQATRFSVRAEDKHGMPATVRTFATRAGARRWALAFMADHRPCRAPDWFGLSGGPSVLLIDGETVVEQWTESAGAWVAWGGR